MEAGTCVVPRSVTREQDSYGRRINICQGSEHVHLETLINALLGARSLTSLVKFDNYSCFAKSCPYVFQLRRN